MNGITGSRIIYTILTICYNTLLRNFLFQILTSAIFSLLYNIILFQPKYTLELLMFFTKNNIISSLSFEQDEQDELFQDRCYFFVFALISLIIYLWILVIRYSIMKMIQQSLWILLLINNIIQNKLRSTHLHFWRIHEMSAGIIVNTKVVNLNLVFVFSSVVYEVVKYRHCEQCHFIIIFKYEYGNFSWQNKFENRLNCHTVFMCNFKKIL